MQEQNTNNSISLNVTRGVCRLLVDMGYQVIREFKLTSGRRVDVAGLNASGKFVVVEVKSSPADFLSDKKWQDYLLYCDRFYFSVNADFPKDILPVDYGLMVADTFGAVIYRNSPETPINGQRRRAQTLRFALTAARRLEKFHDPNGSR